MKLTWLTQGSFLFDYSDIGGPRILVDPYMSDCLAAKGLQRLVPFPMSIAELRPDLLVCTHDHLDHLDPETVHKIAAYYPDCILAGPISCLTHYQQMELKERCFWLMRRYQPLECKGVILTPIPAEHSDPEAIGIMLEAARKKCYLTGDTLYREMLFNKLTENINLLLICINGRLGNMSLTEALQVAKRLKPAVALPMHFGLFAENTADPQPFVDGCLATGINSWIPVPGVSYNFR